jgi:CheY-like chemotaxis protein
VVSDVGKLLARLLGENIELRTTLEPQLHLVRADPGQMEQVIVNLAINARDAMPGGGQLWIETHNVSPTGQSGNFVQLLVRDTGIGMNEDVKSHVFEPFFTTKELGKGTGLGLATVHGIVTQSGGFVEVESEAGAGATFKVYLPALEQVQSAAAAVDATLQLLRGNETILLVEDEDAVRQLARTILEGRGFQVLAAPSGPEALEILGREAQRIDLLLTDIVMPYMSGKQLAASAVQLRPDLKVVFISGYESDEVETYDPTTIDAYSLSKPFDPHELVQAVRSALDGR